MNSFQSVVDQSLLEAQNLILESLNGGTFTITLNRPKFGNSFTFGMYARLQILIDKANSDDNVKVVLVTATGKNFCAGNDFGNFTKIDLDSRPRLLDFTEVFKKMITDLQSSIVALTKPLICCAQGAIVGFMFNFLALFDQIYITKDTFFISPMIKLEQVQGQNQQKFLKGIEFLASYTFPRLFGHQKAFELLILGRKLNSQDALSYRFVSQVFEDQTEMLKQAVATCKEIEKMNHGCVTDAKALMRKPILKTMLQVGFDEIEKTTQIYRSPAFPVSIKRYMKSMVSKPKL